MSIQTETAERILAPYQKTLSVVEKGQNILFHIGDTYALMKYERHDIEVEHYNEHRVNRNVCIVALPYFLFENKKAEDSKVLQKNNEWKRHKGNFYGTHCLDFTFDEEFNIFLPSSSRSDLYLTLATEDVDGKITPRDSKIEIFIGDDCIASILARILRPAYFDAVVRPFLKARSTVFEMPYKKKRWFKKIDLTTLLARYEKVVKDLAHGAFVYVGCKEEVYLLGVAKENGQLYMQGTYTTSTKPPLYFSNNYLNFISKHDAEKPKFKGNGICNVAEYRTYDILGFNGKPFIFPQMGREQNCKNVIFTGEPDVITGDIDDALAHFATTNFAEFSDIVKKYAANIYCS